ncbi:MAG: exodeoxyribonuclease VII small subunit [Roseburia sp.]
MKLEENFTQIEDIIRQMENPEVSLDESFALYQSGIGKLKECNAMLDEVEKKMQILNADGTIGEME